MSMCMADHREFLKRCSPVQKARLVTLLGQLKDLREEVMAPQPLWRGSSAAAIAALGQPDAVDGKAGTGGEGGNRHNFIPGLRAKPQPVRLGRRRHRKTEDIGEL